MFRADRQAVYAGRQGLIIDRREQLLWDRSANLIICSRRLPLGARKPGPIGHQGEQNGQTIVKCTILREVSLFHEKTAL